MHSKFLFAAAALFCVRISSATCGNWTKITQNIYTNLSFILETLNCTGQSSCSFTPKVYNITVAREIAFTGAANFIPSQNDSENIGNLAEANFDHEALPSGNQANFSIGAATVQRIDTSIWNSDVLKGYGGKVAHLYWSPRLAVENGTLGGCADKKLEGVNVGISVPVKDKDGIVTAEYGSATSPSSLGNRGQVSWGTISLSMVFPLIL